MVDGDNKIKSFEDMISWQESIDLAVAIYKLTKKFPADEKFGLTSQIKRAVSSISANLAEGFGRYGIKEKSQFYKIAYGSLLEVKSFLYLAEKLNYITSEDLKSQEDSITLLQKRINKLLTAVKNRDL